MQAMIVKMHIPATAIKKYLLRNKLLFFFWTFMFCYSFLSISDWARL